MVSFPNDYDFNHQCTLGILKLLSKLSFADLLKSTWTLVQDIKLNISQSGFFVFTIKLVILTKISPNFHLLIGVSMVTYCGGSLHAQKSNRWKWSALPVQYARSCKTIPRIVRIYTKMHHAKTKISKSRCNSHVLNHM